MKYATALILAGVLGSGFGVGSPLYAAATRAIARPASRQVVFVDKAELARLHPGWQALDDMRAALAGTGSAGGGSSTSGGQNYDRAAGTASRGAAVGRSRSELVAKAASDASAALDGLEKRKYSALKARREAMRSQLLKSSEAEWKAEARNIEEAAGVETKLIDDRHSSDLVNARLRVSASEIAATVSQKTDSGMDKDATNEKLRSANADLAGVGSVDDAEKGRIMAAANAKIDAVRQASEKRVAERVSAYEAEQSKLIAGSMAAARGEIAQELGPVSTPALFAGQWCASALSDNGVNESRVGRVVDLQAAVSALQVRIDKDVGSMVLDLAAEKGLKVTFERQRGETRDATKTFAGLIQKHGWKK